MVKINLKNSIPIKSSEKIREETKIPPAPKTKPAEPAATEADKIFTPLDIPAPPSEPVAEPLPTEEEFQIIEQPEEPPTKKMRFRTQQEPLDLMEEKWESPSSGIFKKVLIAILILVVIGGVGGGIYKLTDGFSHLPFSKTRKAPVTVKKPQPTTPAEKPTTIPAVYQENAAINQFIYNTLQQLISKKPATVRYALMVLTPSEINLTLVSDSEGKITQFKNDLNKEIRGLNLKTLSSRKRIINNTSMYFADLKTSISGSQLPSATGPTGGSTVPSANLSEEIQALAKKHKIQIEKIQSGKRRDTPTFSENPYYLNVHGSKDNLLNFLSEMLSGNPAIRLVKLSLNPTNMVTFSEQQLSVRLNVSQINLK